MGPLAWALLDVASGLEVALRRWNQLTNLWHISPRDVRTEQLFANEWVFRIKPLKVKLLAGEQNATEQPLEQLTR